MKKALQHRNGISFTPPQQLFGPTKKPLQHRRTTPFIAPRHSARAAAKPNQQTISRLQNPRHNSPFRPPPYAQSKNTALRHTTIRREEGGKRKEEGGERNASGRGRDRKSGPRKPEEGYARLFLNIGKEDGFYPGEVMQFVNRHVEGRQAIGHIDLMPRFSYIEVPQEDAAKVMRALDGANYRGRNVRCNDADTPRGERGGDRPQKRGGRKDSYAKADRNGKPERAGRRGKARFENEHKQTQFRKDDWLALMHGEKPTQLRGDEPDFSEEGWARRKPKKGKK